MVLSPWGNMELASKHLRGLNATDTQTDAKRLLDLYASPHVKISVIFIKKLKSLETGVNIMKHSVAYSRLPVISLADFPFHYVCLCLGHYVLPSSGWPCLAIFWITMSCIFWIAMFCHLLDKSVLPWKVPGYSI